MELAGNIFVTIGCMFLYAATVDCMSIRKIYTLFTEPKTWNEAKTICETQYGQLVKLKTNREMHEIRLMDETAWQRAFHNNTGHMWTGLHKPFDNGNDSKRYQDCEEFGLDSLLIIEPTSYGECGSIDTDFRITFRDCNETGIFMCERFGDDCWYEPFKETVFSVSNNEITISGVADVNECALHCRNYTNAAGNECWGFYHLVSLDCVLYIVSGDFASTAMVNQSNQFPSTSLGTMYIRRCFEGTLDTETYPDVVNDSPEADTICDTTTYPGDPQVAHICFCSVDTQPPIPEPISSEAKAESLAKELTIDTSNTSSAQRKLVSAKDNRPSAVGVGVVGVTMLTVVFGGLMLMDINVAITALRQIISATAPSPGAPAASGVNPAQDMEVSDAGAE